MEFFKLINQYILKVWYWIYQPLVIHINTYHKGWEGGKNSRKEQGLELHKAMQPEKRKHPRGVIFKLKILKYQLGIRCDTYHPGLLVPFRLSRRLQACFRPVDE